MANGALQSCFFCRIQGIIITYIQLELPNVLSIVFEKIYFGDKLIHK